jgi:hypothetical protein
MIMTIINKIGNILNKNKTLLILLIFIIIIFVLYLLYNNNSNKFKKTLFSTSSNNNTNSNFKQKFNQKLKENDKFIDMTLQQLNSIKNLSDEIEIEINDSKQIGIINNYNDFFDEDTSNVLNEWIIENPNIVNENISKMVNNYNNFMSNVDELLEETNYQLLKQLQKNYALAHKVNIKRQIDLENIDKLPQRFD